MRGGFGLLMGSAPRGGAPLIGVLLLGSLMAATGLGSTSLPGRGQGFGRWETPLSTCRMRIQGQAERRCARLRLDQTLEGVLSVRFVGEGEGGRLASEELTFAGVLPQGQKPMRCRPDGRCGDPPQPLSLRVASVAWARFNGRGLVDGLPQARLARGQCRLDRQAIRCEARLDGDAKSSWMVQAQLLP